jgi:hypothetical protein
MKIIITESQYKLLLETKITQEEEDYLKEVVRGYIDAALWTEEERLKDEMGYDDEDDDDEEMSEIDMIIKSYNKKDFSDFEKEDINIDSLLKTYDEIKKFTRLLNQSTLNEVEPFELGMDFWLTRNHHGSGFWDKSYSEEAEEDLMSAVKNFKEKNLIIGDDMMLYFE